MASRQRPRCATLMPNSTCFLASFLASANDTDGNSATRQAAQTKTPDFIGFYWPLYRTGDPTEQAMCHSWLGRNQPDLRTNAASIYETRSCVLYFRRQGGHVPAQRRRGG